MNLVYVYGRAMILKRTLGTRTAAGFLRNKGVNLVTALAVLTTRYGKQFAQ
jgi:hypothetical protein